MEAILSYLRAPGTPRPKVFGSIGAEVLMGYLLEPGREPEPVAVICLAEVPFMLGFSVGDFEMAMGGSGA
jgi:hypothetical protein